MFFTCICGIVFLNIAPWFQPRGHIAKDLYYVPMIEIIVYVFTCICGMVFFNIARGFNHGTHFREFISLQIHVIV